jgi:hypothetical protein
MRTPAEIVRLGLNTGWYPVKEKHLCVVLKALYLYDILTEKEYFNTRFAMHTRLGHRPTLDTYLYDHDMDVSDEARVAFWEKFCEENP